VHAAQRASGICFFGFPDSYGTSATLRVRVKTIRSKNFRCASQHSAPSSMPVEYFRGLQALCVPAADSRRWRGVRAARAISDRGYVRRRTPFVSDYTFEHIYYRSIREKATDYLTTHDFLWRWAHRRFWCSKNFGVQKSADPPARRQARLNSRTYTGECAGKPLEIHATCRCAVRRAGASRSSRTSRHSDHLRQGIPGFFPSARSVFCRSGSADPKPRLPGDSALPAESGDGPT